MSETSSATASKKLLLETSQGQVEIAFLPELAPNHVTGYLNWHHLDFMMGLFSTVLFRDLWPKLVTQQALAWADLAPILMPNSLIMNTVLALLVWPDHLTQTAATVSFLSVLTVVVI